ncbi:MAG TPA: PLP-dependent aspartate aminotransferase family protein [Bdellovibrionota bacterium]|jgi:cystathionine gamma-lyase|nr:PLP-dependent aspartate aminotransferase family protein [Bdellovibrionota bacterium]
MNGHFGDPKKRLEKFRAWGTGTNAIHGAQEPDPVTGAVMPAIYQTSTYAQTAPGKPIGEFEYSRTHNPTRRTFEDALALMEKGTYGLATSSGMSAVTLALSLLKSGDEVICCDDVYGGTYRLFTKLLKDQGLSFKFIDLTKYASDPRALKDVASPKTKMVWIETPTNPLLKLIDIQKITEVCREQGWISVVDNTFASPICQQPLALGADIVMHSLTKYVGGHSDTVAGALVTDSKELADKLYFNQNSFGFVLPPFDSWLLLRSLKTLPVRMRAHEANAMKLAEALKKHPKVEKVIYPGLEDHPQHKLARTQMTGFSGMLSFYCKGGEAEARKVLGAVQLFTLAESLGGVESLIEHPAIMTHASVPKEMREANGIGDNFIRVSVGLEDFDDLWADMDRALKLI